MSTARDLQATKELLLTRSAVERIELSERVGDLRRAVTPGAVFRLAVPAVGARGLVTMLLGLLKRYPTISTAGSLVVSRMTRSGSLAVRALRWASVGVLVWQAVSWWRSSTGSGRR